MLQLARNGADDDPPHCCVKLGGSSSEIPILTCRFLPVVGQTAKPKNCDSFVLYNKGVLEGVKNDWELLLKDLIVKAYLQRVPLNCSPGSIYVLLTPIIWVSAVGVKGDLHDV